MTQRSRDHNWRNVRAVYDELARIVARNGLHYRIEVELGDVGTAMLTCVVWRGDEEVTRVSQVASAKWQYVSEWILEALDEVITELALCGIKEER